MNLSKYSSSDKLDIQELVESTDQKKAVQQLKKLIKSQLAQSSDLEKFLDDDYSCRILEEIDTQPENLANIQTEILTRKKNFQKAVANIFEPIANTPNLLNQQDENLQKTIQEFRQLTTKQQDLQIKALEQDILERQQTLDALLSLSQDTSEFEQLSLKKRKAYLKKRSQTQNTISNITNDYPDFQAEVLKQCKQQTLNQNLKLLAKLKRRVSTENPLNKRFPNGDGKTQTYYSKLYPDFLIQNEAEKQKILAMISQDLKLKYINKINQSKELAPKDIEIMKGTTQSIPFDIKLVCSCLDYFDMSIQIAVDCTEYAKSIRPEILHHFNWDNIGSFDRKTLIKSGKIEKYTQEQSHLEFDKLFLKHIKNFFTHKNLCYSDTEVTNIITEFQNANLQEKHSILNFLNIKHNCPIKLQLKDKSKQPSFLKNLHQREQIKADFEKTAKPNQTLYEKEFSQLDLAKKCELLKDIQLQEVKKQEQIKTFLNKAKEVFGTNYLSSIETKLTTSNLKTYQKPLQKHQREVELIQETVQHLIQEPNISKKQKLAFQKDCEQANNPAMYEKVFIKYQLLQVYQSKQFQKNNIQLQKQIKNGNLKAAIETIEEQIQICQEPKSLKQLFLQHKQIRTQLDEQIKNENPDQNHALKLLREIIIKHPRIQLHFEKIQIFHQVLKLRTVQDYFQNEQEESYNINLDQLERFQDAGEINQKIQSLDKQQGIELTTNKVNVKQQNLPTELLKQEIKTMCGELENILLKHFRITEFSKDANIMTLLQNLLNKEVYTNKIWQNLD